LGPKRDPEHRVSLDSKERNFLSLKSLDFCAGTYIVAAKVSESTYVPLVRENQTFEVGIRYTLRIQIRRAPKTTRTKRWVK
jgi:hypothetical protein